MPGPRPRGETARRNAATIPGTRLPADGRPGRVPAVPAVYELGKAGRAWWQWAWKLPQAAAWDAGSHYMLARRAALEDDLAALDATDELVAELDEELAAAIRSRGPLEHKDLLRALDYTIRKLKSLASGRTSVLKEMRELDNRFGLNPKAMIELRWSIEAAEPEKPKPPHRRRRRAVDPASKARTRTRTRTRAAAK